MIDVRYVSQTQLLLRCLPELQAHAAFALKGGTAINLFVRDLPRVSVDIDLTYLPRNPREEALADISQHLRALGGSIQKRIPGVRVAEHHTAGYVDRLTVASAEAVIKIEPNTVFRGCVYPTDVRELAVAAADRFGMYVRAQTLSLADLYGGKLCAALDRQHPRDLFDVKLLLEAEGLTREICRAFVVYLAGHNRPMSELLAPHAKDVREAFEAQLRGMTREDVPLDSLIAVQRELLRMLLSALDEDERAFLLLLKQGTPDWDRLGLKGLDRLPALQWKLQNIRSMAPDKHRQAVEKLARILSA